MTEGLAIGLLLLAGGGAHAQTSPAQPSDVRKLLNQTTAPKPATSQAQTNTPKPAVATAPTMKAPGQGPYKPAPKTTVKVAGQPTAKATGQPGATTAAQPTAKVVGPSAAKPAQASAPEGTAAEQAAPEHAAARRDPFDPLIGKDKTASGPQVALPAGKGGLVVGTLLVDGVVSGPNGMIAIVSNPQMRVYFLREGDRLYDGDVEHITLEGISFHETGQDAFGKPVEREVTKRLYATPGEAQ